MVHKKINLAYKICEKCHKKFTWRKKWSRDWDHVKYCSQRCKNSKNTKISITRINNWLIFLTINLALLFYSQNSYSNSQMTKILNQDFDKNVKNILGTKLEACCFNPLTGYFRDGYCHTNQQDRGTHIICAQVTDEFLNFSKSRGNDLITPALNYNFTGLKAGDFWCLCILRWLEALDAGVAPPIKLESTHHKALEYVDLKTLKKFQVPKPKNKLVK